MKKKWFKACITLLILFSPYYFGNSKNIPEYYVSLDRDNRKTVINEIKNTKKELLIAMYVCSDPTILKEIVKLIDQGVKVYCIIDSFSELYIKNFKEQHKIKRTIFKSKDKTIFHHKFAVIDEKTTIMGSCNWSKKGFDQNYEDIVVINNIKIATKFKEYFKKFLWDFSKIKI